MENGGPAPESVTNAMYELTKTLSEYRICPDVSVDLSINKETSFLIGGKSFLVEVVDSVEAYTCLMKEIFDFPLIKNFLKQSKLKMRIDSMNGVMGPFAKSIFINELGASSDSIVNSTPLEDFGGLHPDPNLTYAADLVEAMKSGDYGFGVAFDGDGDRNMILGEKAFFVTPSDSLAVLAANLECIPYFKKNGVNGFARSMPTAGMMV